MASTTDLLKEKIEELVGGREDEDYFIDYWEDLGDKYKVVVDISYLYEYLDEETIEELLKAFDHAYIEVYYTNATLTNKIEIKNGKVVSYDVLEDYGDFHAKLIVYINK